MAISYTRRLKTLTTKIRKLCDEIDSLPPPPNIWRGDRKVSCPKCKSGDIRYRVRTEDFVCRICGNIWSKE